MLIEHLREVTGAEGINPRQMAPLALAFLGDSVFDLYIRGRLVMTEQTSPHRMHLHASQFARAESQARMVRLLWDDLSADEQDLVRRGRNAKSNTIPKHAEVIEYKMATGLETMIGALYLEGRMDRILELMDAGYALLCREWAADEVREHEEPEPKEDLT
ncbi:MAG: Mini-ribonuclease 3 [Firmicutes bacterium]|nr:Mini-ribonuclease 3 [Bacillota bacterium]